MYTCKNCYSSQKGFTLIELMVVVAIVAIIVAIAYPSYQDNVKSSKRSEAQGALVSFSAAMEKHFTQNNSYLNAGQSGDTGAPAVFATTAPVGGSSVYYDLTIEAATGSSYTLRATPTNSQTGDGFLEYNSLGQKSWDEDNSGAIGANEFDWDKN
ncbi:MULTISPECIES: type IV pilin protein [unclassified Oleiphilus]|uniref:type IV pilin protein n=2 Tax=Oleiphilus TaxID=141450 RepID=UPI0007C2FF7D|nr:MULTISPECIES: type IV pilin protein [unclassified Oleiphilus]KZY45937.1 general secretion pathway protein GspH [Oleiphilus sp. HI0050]KZY75349.1 general secretion pathway protein GspH [Oleiphilus sp. HI0068]KZY77699.1 general secretion pathway protein GspH [Oleiphilus sp. HI0069]KZZ35352.1 general secretion pathway protein GspH [Oleiphilus sp. HI0085]KZY48146.1 general secretion pathway protein GspH [Oleiphilus sp. HI0050]